MKSGLSSKTFLQSDLSSKDFYRRIPDHFSQAGIRDYFSQAGFPDYFSQTGLPDYFSHAGFPDHFSQVGAPDRLNTPMLTATST